MLRKPYIRYKTKLDAILNQVDSVKTDTCWNWVGTIKDNRPTFRFKGDYYCPIEESYILNIGEIIPHLLVLQTCGNRLCVNPNHLYLGRDFSRRHLPNRIYANKFNVFKYYCPENLSSDVCWDWRGNKSHGYGCMTCGGKWSFAHRVSYELHFGDIPDKIEICHTCDNPACINPSHLFPGTHKDNMEDMVKKGRHKKSYASGKLSETDVLEIRKNFAEGVSAINLGYKYKVSKHAIYDVLNKVTWSHIN